MSTGLSLLIHESLCLQPAQAVGARSGWGIRFGGLLKGTLGRSNHTNPSPAVTDRDDPS